jgi:energy-coupling factor transport system permease protein
VRPQGYLGARQPVVKLAVVIGLSLALFLAIDPITPLLFCIVTLAAGIVLGRLSPSAYPPALAPLVLVALGFVWTNALFARTVDPAAPSWSVGPLRATLPGLVFGIAIGLRGLAIGALSVTFVLTTDPTDLVVGLIRHARVPFRIAYPLLAAYRFLPFFRDELDQIDLARRVRGQLVDRGPLAGVARRVGEVVPLIAGAVRRASRIAVAMDARAFAAATSRTYLRESLITPADGAFAVGALALAIAVFTLGALGGWLRIWDGRFAL